MKKSLSALLLLFVIASVAYCAWLGFSLSREDPAFEPGLLEMEPQSFLAPYTFSEPQAWALMTDCTDGTETDHLGWCLRASGSYSRSEYHEVLTEIDLLASQVAIIDTSPTLNEAANNGAFILGRNSEANATIIACVDRSAPLDGDCTDSGDQRTMEWHDPVNGAQRKVHPDGHLDNTIPDTFAFILRSTSAELERLTDAGVHSVSNGAKYESKVGWEAGGIQVDGTQCTEANKVSEILNSGPKKVTIRCADNNSSIIYGSTPGPMPAGWDEGTIQLCLSVWHGTTETITLAGDFQCQCHDDGEVVDSSWSSTGAASDADLAITTAFRYEVACSDALTCAGTCDGQDIIDWKYTVDAANTSANAANTRIISAQLIYTRSSRDDF